MRKIILAVVMGVGLSALAGQAAQAQGYHHYWRHHHHHFYHHHPIFFTPDYYDYYPEPYDPYYYPRYEPYYGGPGLFFDFGFGHHHHW